MSTFSSAPCSFFDLGEGEFEGWENNDTDPQLYQICTCKRHLWSKRGKKMMLVGEDGKFLVSGLEGTRRKVKYVQTVQTMPIVITVTKQQPSVFLLRHMDWLLHGIFVTCWLVFVVALVISVCLLT